MFQIIKDGAVIDRTESPNYIKTHENGCFVLCSEDEAEGIAHAGEVYSLLGRAELDGRETIALKEVDVGEELRRIDDVKDTARAVSLLALSNMGVDADPAELAAAQDSLLTTAEVEITTEPTGDWKGEEWVSEGDTRTYNKTDYTARQRHFTQAHYPPDTIPALWAVKGAGAGTVEDPITAAAGMEYQYGLYYLDPEDGKTYLCARSGEAEGGTVILQYLPHALIGHYFTEV